MRTRTCCAWIGLMAFSILVSPVGASLRKGPYLTYEGVNTQMTVLWQTDGSGTEICTIEWGLDTSCSGGTASVSTYRADHLYEYAVGAAPGDELTPESMYYYRVTDEQGASYTGSFTAAPWDNATHARLMAFGDTRANAGLVPYDYDSVCETMNTRAGFHTLALHVGDWINSDTENDWQTMFFNRSLSNAVDLHRKLPIVGCRGNHEGSGNVYQKYYPFPSSFRGAFDYGPAHVIIVDQYTGYARGTSQYNAVLNSLLTTPKTWRFLVFHVPAYSSSGGHGGSTTAQAFISDLLLDGASFDIVFAGHNHYYARTLVNGVQHVVTGGGGAPLASPGSGADVALQVLQFCEIDMAGDTLTFHARNLSGSSVDTFTITRSNDFDPPQPDPMTWGSDPTVTSDSVTLTATLATDPSGVEYYFTCTAGDGHDSGWQDSPTYTDTGLVPETQYTYTVTARDTSGNDNTTADSEVVSVLTAVDQAPPTPDPMTWQTPPYATGITSISMTATTAYDPSGVEYYFACTVGDGHDSGWQDSPSYQDTGLDPDAQYIYTVRARDRIGLYETAPSEPASAMTDRIVASSDIPVDGTVVASDYLDTHGSDDNHEEIREVTSGGKKQNRHSYLEHKWTFSVVPGETVTFYVEAHHTDNAEGDDFVFAYSTDDVSYVNMLTCTKTSDDRNGQTFVLPDHVSGILYVRVKDTDRSQGHQSLDTLYVDEMFISVQGAGSVDLTPPTPDPMTWGSMPSADSSQSITMTAALASDPSGSIEYYFACTSGGGNDSGWQTGTTYRDTGLSPDTQYTYTVKAKDLGSNETSPAAPQSATTDPFGGTPGQATDPDPADGQTRVNRNAALSWTPGLGAVTHNVYLWITSSDPAAATPVATTGPTYAPPLLERRTAYSWRVDEVNGEEVTVGQTWSFTTK